MKTLKDILDLVQNNDEQVILKVKEDCEAIDLIMNGFDGEESMFRVTKGHSHTYTTWTKNGDNYSCNWGSCGTTLISENWNRKKWKIVNYIEKDLGIRIE